MKIAKVTRFEDVDYDNGYSYCGYYYDIQNEEDVFLIRMYDDDPGQATVLRPTTMSAIGSLRKLVEFLKSDLGVSRISLYKGELGTYAEIDVDNLAFRPV